MAEETITLSGTFATPEAIVIPELSAEQVFLNAHKVLITKLVAELLNDELERRIEIITGELEEIIDNAVDSAVDNALDDLSVEISRNGYGRRR